MVKKVKVFEIYVSTPNGGSERYPMSMITDFTAACKLRDYVVAKLGHPNVYIMPSMANWIVS